MNSDSRIPSFAVGIVVFAAICVILLTVRTANAILSPILLAVVIAIVMSPLLKWFLDRGVPNWLALTLTISIFIVVLVVFVWLVSISLRGFAASVPQYQERFLNIRDSLLGTLSNYGVNADDLAGDSLLGSRNWFSVIASITGDVVSELANWGVVLVAGVFFLVEAQAVPRLVKNLAQEEHPRLKRIARFGRDVRRFMTITAWVGFLTAVFNVGLLALLGVDFILLWGVLSFVLNFVPNIGFVISVIPPALLAFIQFGIPQALIVVVGFIIINGIAENVVKPRLIEQDFDLSPAVTFVSLILWTWVLGPLGAILAVPMTLVVQLLLESTEETRWIGYALGTGRTPYLQEANHEVEQEADDASSEPQPD